MSEQAPRYQFTATLAQYPGAHATWHFVPLPKHLGRDIHARYGALTRGFGSLPVRVTIGNSTWQTSIFRDSSADSYLLFIKAKVRSGEALFVGDTINVICEVLGVSHA